MIRRTQRRLVSTLCVVGGCLVMVIAPRAFGQCEANELVKLTADDAATSDKFGISVALENSTLVIGAFGDENETGAVYVFTGSGADWSQQAKLTPYDGQFTDFYGYSIAISGDTIVVGSRYDDDMGDNSGSAYVYVRERADWNLQAKLLADDGEAVDKFGTSVAIDGDTIVVGAVGDDDAANSAGAAYVFVRTGTTWTRQEKLVPGDGSSWDEFGTAVAILGDTAIIGSIGDDDHGDCAGAAFVYERDGLIWNEKQKLLADDGSASDNFGTSIAIDGAMMVIGTPGDDDMGPTSGSAYVFIFDGANWSQRDKLVALDGSNNAQFGESVALDGDYIVVGAVNETNQGGGAAGSAYVFHCEGGDWTQQAKLLAADAAEMDNAGSAVALSGDTAVVGAMNDDDAGNNSGSAYVFRGIADCNLNGSIDICDIADGASDDANGNGIPDECECPADFDGDGDVDTADLLHLLGAWGTADGDVDGDSDTDTADLLALLAAWGECFESPECPWDLNGDDVVDDADRDILMAHWGDCPEPPEKCPWDLNGDGVVDGLDLMELMEHYGPCPA